MSNTFAVTTIQRSGNEANRWNFVFLAEGWQASEQANFIAAVQSKVNYLLTSPLCAPYGNYAASMNFYAIGVVSNQSGISHPHTAPDCPSLAVEPIISVNTYFSISQDSSNIHRWLQPSANAQNLAQQVLTANFSWYSTPAAQQRTVVIFICNSPYYAGGQYGSYALCAMDSNSNEILPNELHKAWLGVGDEYMLNSAVSWNITNNPDITKSQWANWAGTTGIGMFPVPNGGYIPTNQQCKEFTLGRPFCPICQQRLVVVCNNYLNLIDSYTPNVSATTLVAGGNQTFTINCIKPSPDTLAPIWKLDGVQVGTGYSYTLQNDSTIAGLHTLVASVQDSTILSKSALHIYSQQWNVTISKPNPVQPPSPPTGLTTAGTDTITLQCSPVSGATAYTFKLNIGTTQVSSQPTTSFSGLTPKTNYSATVTATTSTGTSIPSSPFNFVTP